MQPHRLEARVHEIVDRVTVRAPVEDSRVELKSTWIEAPRAARRLAAHANGAYGEPILWVVGIDEGNATIPGARTEELANWWAQVQSNFDLVYPELLDDLVVPIQPGVAVAAMRFDTRQAPYVVRNPAHGSTADPVAWEVPWRDGTRTRSARRSELLRILSPLQLLPEVDVMRAFLGARERVWHDPDGKPHPALVWYLSAAAYFVPRDAQPVTLPFHRCRAEVNFAKSDQGLSFEDVTLGPQMEFVATPTCGPFVSTVVSSGYPPPQPIREPKPIPSEWILRSPTRLLITGDAPHSANELPEGKATLTARLGVVGSERDIELRWDLLPVLAMDDDTDFISTWESWSGDR